MQKDIVIEQLLNQKAQGVSEVGCGGAQQLLDRFTKLLTTIEKEENYYAMFISTYEQCIIAKEELRDLFWTYNMFSDEIYHDYAFRIETAKKNMIKTNFNWTVRQISKTLSIDDAVSSVYNQIFHLQLSDMLQSADGKHKQKSNEMVSQSTAQHELE